MPRRHNLHRYSELQQRIIALAVDWKSTPSSLRPYNSLREAALAAGIDPTKEFYRLAESPDVYHQMLLGQAGNALQHVPAVLTSLVTTALAGERSSVAAAEAFLEWTRKLLTDAKFLELAKPSPTIEASVDSIANSARIMAAYISRLPQPEPLPPTTDAEFSPSNLLPQAEASDEPLTDLPGSEHPTPEQQGSEVPTPETQGSHHPTSETP